MVFKFIPVTWGTKFHISSSINRDLHVTFSSSINQKKKEACLYLSAHRATIEFIVPFQPVAASPLFSLCRFIAEPITWFISILCKCFRSICAPAVLIIQFALGLCVVFRFQYHWSALIILSYYTFIRRQACYMLPRSLLYLLGPCINSPSCLPANEVHFKVILKLSSLSFCTQNQPNQHLTNVQVTPEACVNEWINFNWLWGRPGTEVHFLLVHFGVEVGDPSILLCFCEAHGLVGPYCTLCHCHKLQGFSSIAVSTDVRYMHRDEPVLNS